MELVEAEKPVQIPASVVFQNIIKLLKEGFFPGDQSLLVVQAIHLLEQIASSEKKAEEAKDVQAHADA